MNEFLLQDIAAWLESESIGLDHGVSVFSGNLPDSTGNAVGILHYGSAGASFAMDTDDNLPITVRPLVQALTRHSDWQAGYETAHAVHRAMLQLVGVEFLHTKFKNITPIQSVPFPVGDTADGDALFSCNYEIEVDPS